MQARTVGSDRLSALDGLRGLACLMVFGVHFGQISRLDGRFGPFELGRFLENGNTGVALFFVLSGFLLSLPFWAAVEGSRGGNSMAGYLARRAARILPAYFVCLTGLVILNRHWREPGGWQDIAAHYALVFNYFESSIFAINPPFWTLAVEAQFYLVLPLLFIVVRRLGRMTGFWLVAALALASWSAYYWLCETAATSAAAPRGPVEAASAVRTYSLLGHLPHFLLGVLAASVLGWIRDVLTRHAAAANWVSAVALAAVLIVLSTILDDLLRVPHGRYNLPYVPVLLAALIVSAPFAPLARGVFGTFPLAQLGAISYGIYIYHLPILNATARYGTRIGLDPRADWIVFGALGLVITIIVASLSFLLIERPVLRWVHARSTGKARA